MKQLVDVHYPEAELVSMVLDNLNIHALASLYEAFQPAEARRIVTSLRFHYTPKHGSWLNPAELELSAFTRQCLNRRIPELQALRQQAAAWEAPRNEEQVTIQWRFAIQDARTKLQRLYPNLQ